MLASPPVVKIAPRNSISVPGHKLTPVLNLEIKYIYNKNYITDIASPITAITSIFSGDILALLIPVTKIFFIDWQVNDFLLLNALLISDNCIFGI